MKKKFLLLMIPFLLSGCKVDRLYERNLYNSPNFDENYYTFFERNIQSKEVSQSTSFRKVSSLSGLNLGETDEAFKQGILSKLYDGRIQCDGYYQRSRVQMNDKGYGTSFPKQLENAKYIALAIRA